MDTVSLISGIGAIVGTPVVAIIGYFQRRLNKIEEKMSVFITSESVTKLLHDNMIQTKDKIEDKYEPIQERLDRLENKIDALIARGLLKND